MKTDNRSSSIDFNQPTHTHLTMPGLRTRTSRSQGATSISSEPRRAATAASSSTATVAIPSDPPQSDLRLQICQIFHNAQRSLASQRKCCISLHRLQSACRSGTPNGPTTTTPDQDPDADAGEAAFEAEVARCILRVLGVKRGEGVGDRTVRFVGSYLAHAEEKDAAALVASGVDEEEFLLQDTPTSRLTGVLIATAVKFMGAKEKLVRYRATQLVAEIVRSVSSIGNGVLPELRMALLRAMRDRESHVRVQAVVALGRLVDDGAAEDEAAEEDEEEDEDGDGDATAGLLPRLLDMLQNDQSAEVRKILLMNLPVTPTTLPYLLERARDQDAATRRALYSRLLPRIGDFRHLTLAMREKLLRWGLRDRDPQVRSATERLFYEQWISDCSSAAAPDPEPSDPDSATLDTPALLELIERIGILDSGAEGGIALEAMRAFWAGRPDYREGIVFGDAFWEGLSSESAFVLRSFSDYCHEPAVAEDNRGGDNARLLSLLEEKLPEVTKFAFYLERCANTLVDSLKTLEAHAQESSESEEQDPDPDRDAAAAAAVAEEEELILEHEFITEQLLHVAHRLDFSDEIGRRKMFALLREMLAVPELPDGIRKLVVEGLKATTGDDAAGERDFCGVVVETIAELHDALNPAVEGEGEGDRSALDGEEESFHSAHSALSAQQPSESNRSASNRKPSTTTPPDPMRILLLNLACLSIAQTTLTLLLHPPASNAHLSSLQQTLILPAVRSYDAPVREQGLICLGLCCLLDQPLARENLPLFQHCFLKGSEALQCRALEVLTDVLLAWQVGGGAGTTGTGLFASEPDLAGGGGAAAERQLVAEEPAGPSERDLLKLYAKALRSAEKPTLQATAATSLAKLLLAQAIPSSSSPTFNTTNNPASTHSDPPTATAAASASEDAVSSLLHLLLKTYFLPSTPSNPALLQCLSYLLPVYAHSSATNQARLAAVGVPVLKALWAMREERDLDAVGEDDEGGYEGAANGGQREGEMVGAGAMAGMLVEWCDGRRVYVPGSGGAGSAIGGEQSSCAPHMKLARDALERLRGSGFGRQERKMWCGLVGKLHFSLPAGPSSLDTKRALEAREAQEGPYRELLELFEEVIAGLGAGVEAASRNALKKACAALEKVVKKMESREEGSGSTARPEHGSRRRPRQTGDLTGIGEDDAEEAEAEAEAGGEGDGDRTEVNYTNADERTLMNATGLETVVEMD